MKNLSNEGNLKFGKELNKVCTVLIYLTEENL